MVTLDQHIEELRAELRGCADIEAARQIEAELAIALSERAAQDARDEAPFG